MKNCKKCNRVIPTDSAYCPYCGGKLQTNFKAFIILCLCFLIFGGLFIGAFYAGRGSVRTDIQPNTVISEISREEIIEQTYETSQNQEPQEPQEPNKSIGSYKQYVLSQANSAKTNKSESSYRDSVKSIYKTVPMQEVESSAISEIGYEKYTETLLIRFKESGVLYAYFEVPQSIYEKLINAESIGKSFNQDIKDIYDYERIDEE